MLSTVLAAAIAAAPLLSGPVAGSSFERAQRQLAASVQAAGPVDGFLPFFAPDGAYLHPGAEIVTGRDAARALLRAAYAGLRAPRTTLHVWAADASADRRFGYSFGWLEETATLADGTTRTSFGRFVAAWRQRDGAWRVQAFLRIESAGAPAAPPADARIFASPAGLVRPDVPAAHRTQMAMADAFFSDLSLAQGYSVAFPAYAADAAVLVTAGNSAWDKAGVAAAMAGWDPTQTLSWYPLRSEAAASGDLGWSIGHGTFAADGGFRSYSKYLTIWIRTAEGWRWLLDAGNERPAP